MLQKQKNPDALPSICLWCEGECGVTVHVKADRLVTVEPDPDWPWYTHRFVLGCARRRAAPEYLYHAARLNFPLKRVGKRGEGHWQRLPWEEALDEIAAKLECIKARYGPEAVATLGKNALPQDEFRLRFLRLFGSSTALEGSVERLGIRGLAAYTITGMLPNLSVRPTTRCIVLLGSEPLVSRPKVAHNVLEALKRGANLIVIDPRPSKAVPRANIWLPLRPGTDTALLLGMAHLIIEEGLYDAAFVNEWCHGFAELRRYLAPYTPEWAAGVTGVPAEKIKAAARLYASNKPAAFVEGRGVTARADARWVLHWRWILAAITGNLDVAGGEELYDLPQGDWLAIGRKQVAFGQGNFDPSHNGSNLHRVALNSSTQPVKALIVQARNPLVTWPGTRRIYEALRKLDLLVVMDAFCTPTAVLADYVLPAACWPERPDVWCSFSHGVYLLVKPAVLPKTVPGKYERYYDFDLWRGLGIRLGQREEWPWATLEEAYTARLAVLGHDLKDRRCILLAPFQEKKYVFQGFATPTGKIELCPSFLVTPPNEMSPYNLASPTGGEDLKGTKEYPFVLVTGGRICVYHCSEWRQIPSVRRRHPYPTVQLHPDVARRIDVQEGDWVWLETAWGKIRQRVRVSENLSPHMVCAEFGWWLPELPGEERCLHGVWEFNANACFANSRPGGVPCRILKANPPAFAVGIGYPGNNRLAAERTSC